MNNVKYSLIKIGVTIFNLPGSLLFGIWNDRHFIPRRKWPMLFLGFLVALLAYALAFIGWLLTLPGRALMLPVKLVEWNVRRDDKRQTDQHIERNRLGLNDAFYREQERKDRLKNPAKYLGK